MKHEADTLMPKLTRRSALLLVPVPGCLPLPLFQGPELKREREVSYTGLLTMGGALKVATIRGNELAGVDEQGNPFVTILPADPEIATRLAERGVEVSIAATPDLASDTLSLAQVVSYYGSLDILFELLPRIARTLEREQGSR